MTEIITPLFESLTLNNGVKLSNRFAMAPMLILSSNPDGTPSQEDFDYFSRRNNFGQLLITGATTISENIRCANGQLVLANSQQIKAFTNLATVMKAKGNKAILQLQHPGREAKIGHAETGHAVAPSAINFPFLDYIPEELTEAAIWQIITDFGAATSRAIQAGFDGVEIHGANHYLIQQFFSSYSNRRTDYWGGSLANRANFAVEVLKEIKKVVKASGKKDFIVGFRISPEEVHGDTIGYTIDEAMYFTDQIVTEGVDYFHTSSFGGGDFAEGAYKWPARAGNTTKPINALIKEAVAERAPLIISGSINSLETALDALNYGDILSMGVAALAEPDFSVKIANGKATEIEMDVSGKLADLAFPPSLINAYKAGAPLPKVTGLF